MEIRRLSLPDLDPIVAIENAVYPTPWSRSMFAGELAKPSSVSLGAAYRRSRSRLRAGGLR